MVSVLRQVTNHVLILLFFNFDLAIELHLCRDLITNQYFVVAVKLTKFTNSLCLQYFVVDFIT